MGFKVVHGTMEGTTVETVSVETTVAVSEVDKMAEVAKDFNNLDRSLDKQEWNLFECSQMTWWIGSKNSTQNGGDW